VRVLAVYRFELAYQTRRLWPWLIAAVLTFLVFLLTRDGALAEALYDEFYVNSPFSIAKSTVVGSLFWLIAGGGIAGEAAARDLATGTYPLVYTTPLSKRAYLGGRFLAALSLNAVLLLAVQLGIVLGVYLPGVDPVLIGPFRPEAHATAFAILSLPTAFAATSLQFALALRSGRPTSGYLGGLALFFCGFFLSTFFIVRWGFGKILDPIGVHFILSDLSHDWTSTEKSWRLLALEGTVLWNRMAWLGFGALTLALTYWRFRFGHRAESSRGWFGRRRAVPVADSAVHAGTTRTRVAVPAATRRFDFAFQARQALAIGVTSFRMLAASWAGRGLLVMIPLLSIVVVIDSMFSLGVLRLPATSLVLVELTGPVTAELSRWVIVPPLLVFFAGELVWRERDAGMGEMTDAMPGSSWTPFLGKLLGLAFLLGAFAAAQIGSGVAAQTILGHHEYELGVFATALFGLQLPEYLLFAVLALVIHVVVDQKYVGHLVGISAYAVIALAPMFGVEHNLLIYGAGPSWQYTAMRGFGASLAPWAWFKLYWSAWAVLLAVAGALLWGRGLSRGLGERLRLARGRFTGPTALVTAAAIVVLVGAGGFVYYNTNVLHRYSASRERDADAAEYERRYRRYIEAPQPQIVGTALQVEIHPGEGWAEIRGTHRLVNRTSVVVDSIHVAPSEGVETGTMTFGGRGDLVLDDRALAHRIYALAEPLAPGDSIEMSFTVRLARRGFTESGANEAIVPNGSYFTSAVLPAIGYQRQRELLTAAERRREGLEARPVIPSLDDERERTRRTAGRRVEVVVGTDRGQVAVGPGALHRQWDEGDRAYFHYLTDAPIGDEFALFSANYTVREEVWVDPTDAKRTVRIGVYHHPAHGAEMDRMVRSIRTSLDHYTAVIGPYRYGHLTFVERAGNGTGMHADASEISFSEGSALLRPRDDSLALDLPFAIVAHEMAHQWVIPAAYVEGAPVISEGLAWFYAMQVAEREYGLGQRRRLLAFMRMPYPHQPIRRGEPLLRGLDPYMSYRKGPFALNALSAYVGEPQVNRALRRARDAHVGDDAPLATMRDLYGELQRITPDSLRPMLAGLFEVNTFWTLEAERVSAESKADGTWDVAIAVRARKVVVDTAGVETDLPMDEWIEVGVFAPVQGEGALRDPIYLERHRIRSGRQTIRVTVPRRPALAGIDPFHVLDLEEKEDDDNIAEVRGLGGPSGG
jgi:ABC-2 type transport system permease protein